MFNLLPRDMVFYDLFERLSGHAVTSSKHLKQLVADFPRIDNAIQRIRNEEHSADELAHQALDRLDRTFITPFDREDIHELVGGLDNIVDTVDALAKRFSLYHVTVMDVDFDRQVDVLVQATTTLSEAVLRLRKSRKLGDLQDRLIEIHRLENVGDDHHHSVMSRLFDGTVSPLDVIKWKELYDLLEQAIDDCEDVSDTLERIVLKNG